GVIGALVAVLAYVATLNPEDQADRMGAIAGVAQNLRLIGALYHIKSVFDMKTTEYVPYHMTFAMTFFILQMTLYSVLSGNYYMTVGSIPGLLLCGLNLSLYVIYPPITWKVPILGTQQRAVE
ncbi:hypothetical protein PENTCL1PPCAC_15013, partial [Pristionchus entomophagus]